MSLSAKMRARVRGALLRAIQLNHEGQERRLTDVRLYSVLDNLRFDVTLDEIITLLQELKGRGYLSFIQEKDIRTHQVSLRNIEITPSGTDVVEGRTPDSAVDVE